MNQPLRILQDGFERHVCAHTELAKQIRAEVEAEFAEQMANATTWQRIKLSHLIRQEIARRLPKPPSLYNLYDKSS